MPSPKSGENEGIKHSQQHLTPAFCRGFGQVVKNIDCLVQSEITSRRVLALRQVAKRVRQVGEERRVLEIQHLVLLRQIAKSFADKLNNHHNGHGIL